MATAALVTTEAPSPNPPSSIVYEDTIATNSLVKRNRHKIKPNEKKTTVNNNNNNNNNNDSNDWPSKTTNTVTILDAEFLSWCQNVLGIETILEIQYFDYPYELQTVLPPSSETQQPQPVRGLAATRNISAGETVIRIPLQALWSVSTTIDQDPVLSRVMGPTARIKNGWQPMEGTDRYMEVPLLAVALLHHKKLGSASPLLPYVRLLEQSRTDQIPILWSTDELNQVTEGIRGVAQGIQQDILDMYENVVQVLIHEHPDLFGAPTTTEKPWMFSLEEFRWAFAVIHSRHWQLPIPDLEPPKQQQQQQQQRNPTVVAEQHQGTPPANMPTDEWVTEEGDTLDNDDDTGTMDPSLLAHSFLAPVADLLNFGPPCTRGAYDSDRHVFEIVATCDFLAGQEVTLWYSDECEDVLAAVYGFRHPLIPPCPTLDEYRHQVVEWKRRSDVLQSRLRDAYASVDELLDELDALYNILDHCAECCRSGARHEHVRGANALYEEKRQMHRIRQRWKHSEF